MLCHWLADFLFYADVNIEICSFYAPSRVSHSLLSLSALCALLCVRSNRAVFLELRHRGKRRKKHFLEEKPSKTHNTQHTTIFCEKNCESKELKESKCFFPPSIIRDVREKKRLQKEKRNRRSWTKRKHMKIFFSHFTAFHFFIWVTQILYFVA